MTKDKWRFEDYMEEIIALSEFDYIPSFKSKRTVLIAEVWQRYPNECEALGLRDQPKEMENV